ncbi:hypothetical protein PVAND_013600 [Polypedilum vanderplanki]|uniref:Aminopeptidase n=1 Tax=Polypedilum vanderplanki TaxID=319348 RepID=A0A9J6CQT3_POLVA|nr:hypothetical protein PVAND_013600 [Polypedilum vanderplanki]
MSWFQVFFVFFLGSSINCIENLINYRLPNDTFPLSYDLSLTNYIHESNFTFNGNVKIHIKIKEETQTVTLHRRDIIIDSIDLYDGNDILKLSNLQFEYLEEFDFIRVNLETPQNKDSEIFLDFTFNGLLEEEASGFFKTPFINSDFRQEWMALTKFESINARKVFVCYDEPQIKAPFRVRIRHDKNYHAISNMPIDRVITNDNIYVTTVFQETPKIQTYALAFVISKLGFIGNNQSEIEQRIFGDPEKIQKGFGNFSLKVVENIVKKFKEIFSKSIPIPKLDHIGIPMISGASEHYGLITYEENFLLIDENFDQKVLDYFQPIIISVIAHEISHQYFGNIVTHSWWNELWLTEGFATFYQYYLPSLIFPKYNFMDKFRNEVLTYAFDIDSDNEISMSEYVESPLEIQMKYHNVVFEKAAAVLRMFFIAFESEVFTNGVKKYLNDNKDGVVTSNDFYKALQSSYNDKNPGSQLDIETIFQSWSNQAGFPIIHARKVNSSVILTQNKFNDENSSNIYKIPITFVTKSKPLTSKQLWMTSQTMIIDNILTSDDWIIFNIQQVGFYRVNYSRDLWQLIINGYSNEIHAINREVLHEEMEIAWQKLKTLKICDCLQFMNVLKYEKDGNVWEKAEYIEKLDKFLQFSDFYPQFKDLLSKIVEPHLNILNEPKVDEKFNHLITRWSKVAQNQDYLQFEFDKLLKFMTTEDERYKPDFCSAFRVVNSSIYEHFIEKVLHFDELIDLDLVFGLGCSLNKNQLKNLYRKITDPSNNVAEWMITEILRTSIEGSEIGLESVMEFIQGNLCEFNKLSEHFIEDIIIFMHHYINSENHLKKFKILSQVLSVTKIVPQSLINSMIESIGMKLQASEWKELKICMTREQTSSTYQAESTTQGASSINLMQNKLFYLMFYLLLLFCKN